jgi:hypothetical protein
MKVMSKQTGLDSEKIIDRVKEHFVGKFGFKVVDDSYGCCLELENNLGFINVQVSDRGDHREVTFTTREWEYQLLEFLGNLN